MINLNELIQKAENMTLTVISSGYLKFVGIDDEDTDWSNAQLTTTNRREMFNNIEDETKATHFYISLTGNNDYIRSFAEDNGLFCSEYWLSDAAGGYGGEDVFIFSII